MNIKYFTFGNGHTHVYNNKVLNEKHIIKITSYNPRQTMFSIFGKQWCCEYDEEKAKELIDSFKLEVVNIGEINFLAYFLIYVENNNTLNVLENEHIILDIRHKLEKRTSFYDIWDNSTQSFKDKVMMCMFGKTLEENTSYVKVCEYLLENVK